MATVEKPKKPPAKLSIPWYCEQFGVSRSLIFKEISAGRIKTKRIGSRVLILERDFQDYLDRNDAEAAK